jgi:hypothetical protein
LPKRIQALGGVSLAMGADVAETTQLNGHLVDEKRYLFNGRD